MKKSIIAIISILLVAGSSTVCQAARKKAVKKVVYSTSMHCKACANKVQDNIAFEKGVQDLNIDMEKNTITVEFNPAKTDTAKLAGAIRKLGYKAKVIEYKDIK